MKNIIDFIRNAVSEEYGVSVDAINGDCRTPDEVHARHVAMYAVREIAETPYKKMAWMFGGRGHTSVIYAVRQIGNLLSMKNKSLIQKIQCQRVQKLLKNIREQIEAQTSIDE